MKCRIRVHPSLSRAHPLGPVNENESTGGNKRSESKKPRIFREQRVGRWWRIRETGFHFARSVDRARAVLEMHRAREQSARRREIILTPSHTRLGVGCESIKISHRELSVERQNISNIQRPSARSPPSSLRCLFPLLLSRREKHFLSTAPRHRSRTRPLNFPPPLRPLSAFLPPSPFIPRFFPPF